MTDNSGSTFKIPFTPKYTGLETLPITGLNDAMAKSAETFLKLSSAIDEISKRKDSLHNFDLKLYVEEKDTIDTEMISEADFSEGHEERNASSGIYTGLLHVNRYDIAGNLQELVGVHFDITVDGDDVTLGNFSPGTYA